MGVTSKICTQLTQKHLKKQVQRDSESKYNRRGDAELKKKYAWTGTALTLAAVLCFTSGCQAKRFLGQKQHIESVTAGKEGESMLSSEVKTEAETAGNSQQDQQVLPTQYDARADGRTAPVKNQGDLGTCWAFASLLALESSLLPEESYDFSEDHMSHDPNFLLDQKSGGDYIMSMAYLLSWRGPVLEADDPYGDGVSPEELTAVRHVQEIQILPSFDREAIKTAVYRIGGVQSALYTTLQQEQDSRYYNKENGAYYYSGTLSPNHDVVIVGWDDDYPAENFSELPPDNGAFLCENSWGTEFGKEGFFYVSYYDTNLGETGLVYSGVEPADNYDCIYQSDRCGWIGQIGYDSETVWGANVYQASKDLQQIRAVGFYAVDADTQYEISLIRNVPEHPTDADWKRLKEEKVETASGTLRYAGYYTIPFSEPMELEEGERFAVMIKLHTPGAIHPMAIEYDAGDGRCLVDLTDGEGYLSADGEVWEKAETEQNCNLCLKAYAVLTEK